MTGCLARWRSSLEDNPSSRENEGERSDNDYETSALQLFEHYLNLIPLVSSSFEPKSKASLLYTL